MMSAPPNHRVEEELSRDLGLPSALAIGVGTMVAAGIFTLSGLAVRNVGSAAVAAFLLAAVVALFTALTYCEFASIHPRSGEGFLYARETFAAPLAWLVGWCLLLGYTSSCGFYISSLSTYWNEFIVHSPWAPLPGIVTLVGLALLNVKGTKESGTFQIVVTLGKVILLVWFVAGGIRLVDPATVVERFNSDLVAIGSTSAMVFITFFGFSAIAASAGEVRHPVKNIPRAIFLSMGIVTVLYTAVVLAIIAADLSEYTEAAMGTAARIFLGPVGGAVIVGGALFSMISASNASIMAVSRVAMAMSQDGHLPRDIGRVDPHTRTPIVAIALSAATIAFFTTSLSLEDLAHFADTVLLLALILVNAALIVHRRRYPDIERPFRVPLVPLLPTLGIVANFWLLSRIAHHAAPFALAVGSLIVGLLGFLTWRGARPSMEELPGGPSQVAAQRRDSLHEAPYRVLVPVAHPDRVAFLIDLAAAIAKEHDGEIVALRVVQVPEQAPAFLDDAVIEREMHVLDAARARAKQQGVPISTVVRVGKNIARAVLETARDHRVDLLVVGWKGWTSTSRRILGETTDTIIAQSRADMLLVKRVGTDPVRRLLLPMAGGVHAGRAAEYAGSIARAVGGEMTLTTVVPTGATGERVTEGTAMLQAAADRVEGVECAVEVTPGDDVVTAIVDAAAGHDAVVIGAAEETAFRRVLFGGIPEEVARRSAKTVIVVKRYERVKAAIGRAISA